MNTRDKAGRDAGTHARFPEQTDWADIDIAGGPASSPAARDALNRLCQIYWPPLYAFARSKGNNREVAQDLTQKFFLHLLQGNFTQKADPGKGRFRNFLLGAFKRFIIDEWRRETSGKRGGQAEVIAIDEQQAESEYAQLPKADPSPDTIYDRAWAQTLIGRVLKHLQQEYKENADLELYEAFQPYLAAEPKEIVYAEMVNRLNRTKNTLQVAWYRLRHRFGELLRAETARTVEKPEEVDGEIRYLLSAWAASPPATQP